jgi:hypothetical protein
MPQTRYAMSAVPTISNSIPTHSFFSAQEIAIVVSSGVQYSLQTPFFALILVVLIIKFVVRVVLTHSTPLISLFACYLRNRTA